MSEKTFFSIDSPSKNSIFNPILAPILTHRPTSAIIVGAAALHAGLAMAGLPGWTCPIREIFGIPCPGCGLSRAIAALLHGNWATSLNYHIFAPFVLLALILMSLVTILPGTQHRWLISKIERMERHTGIAALVLSGMVIYWLARLFMLREAFINLIVG